MRAVFDVVAGQNLAHQRLALFGFGVPACLDCRLARHGVQQIVAQVRFRRALAGEKVLCKRLERRAGIVRRKVCRDLTQHKLPIRKLRHIEAERLQKR